MRYGLSANLMVSNVSLDEHVSNPTNIPEKIHVSRRKILRCNFIDILICSWPSPYSLRISVVSFLITNWIRILSGGLSLIRFFWQVLSIPRLLAIIILFEYYNNGSFKFTWFSVATVFDCIVINYSWSLLSSFLIPHKRF